VGGPEIGAAYKSQEVGGRGPLGPIGSAASCRLICLPVLLYGSETWSLSSSDKYKLNVSWNNCFRRIFNGFWRESVKPMLFYCNSMPLMSLMPFGYSMCLVLVCCAVAAVWRDLVKISLFSSSMQWSRETTFAVVIFKICRQLLGASPADSTGAPPLNPTGGLPAHRSPVFAPPPLIISKPATV